MKQPDKYRFSLQWGVETAEKIQVGELLESLGNRKSEFVVQAVAEYLRNHPEALSSGQKLKIVVRPSFTQEQLEKMVRSIIAEKMANSPPIPWENSGIGGEPTERGSYVEEMLRNLELFL